MNTSQALTKEREKASFEINNMILILDGGKKQIPKKKFIRKPTEKLDYSDRYHMNREDKFKDGVKHFMKIHTTFPKFQPNRDDIHHMSKMISVGGSSLANHLGLFVKTVLNHGDEKQVEWGIDGMRMKIIGCYAQTELGHGSNIRGLETTATYDKDSEEFILNTPNLTSRKWWPGALGKVSTHALVYAQLIIDQKEYGLHIFFLQIRDENHKPMPGIELGDLGEKIGDNLNDTGYMVLNKVRIPRKFMLSRFQQVTKEGKYIKSGVDPKLSYSTMMYARAGMVSVAGYRLSRACVIAIRYNCIRKQGFINSSTKEYSSPENTIIDYQYQKYRLFKQLSICYSIFIAGKWMSSRLNSLEGSQLGIIVNMKELKETASLSAGLKALSTILASDGIEECRKACGGNGYLLSSGISAIAMDYVWQTTAEGDYMILSLLTSKFLLKSYNSVKNNHKFEGTMSYMNSLQDINNIEELNPERKQEKLRDFLDIDYLYELYKFRALKRTYVAAKNFERRLMKGNSLDEASNLSAYELLQTANSNSYFLLLNSFKTFVEDINKSQYFECKKALENLCILFALTSMDKDWNDILKNSQIQLINEAVLYLLEKIRPNALGLAESFDIPDNILASIIGNSRGNVYEDLVESSKLSELNKKEVFDGYKEYLRPHLDLDFLKKGNKCQSKF